MHIRGGENMTHVANSIMQMKELNANEKLILLALCVEGNGTKVSVAQDIIAERCSLTRRSVIKFIQSLEDKGFLKVSRSEYKREGNIYELHVAL